MCHFHLYKTSRKCESDQRRKKIERQDPYRPDKNRSVRQINVQQNGKGAVQPNGITEYMVQFQFRRHYATNQKRTQRILHRKQTTRGFIFGKGRNSYPKFWSLLLHKRRKFHRNMHQMAEICQDYFKPKGNGKCRPNPTIKATGIADTSQSTARQYSNVHKMLTNTHGTITAKKTVIETRG